MLRACTLLLVLLPAGCLSAKIDASCDGLGACGPATTTGTSDTSGMSDTGDGSLSPDTGTTRAATDETTSTGETTTAADASSTGTGDTPAICGNAVVEPGEECDDGDLVPDNGCSETCAADIRAFVSSVTYKAGDLMGLKLADALCFNRADDAGLAEPLRFKAFLSDSTTDARDRFVKGRGRIVMINGLVLAVSWDALLAGALQGPLEVTENSETYHGKVWTGTRPDGTAAPGSSHCADWTSNSLMDNAYYGYSDEISKAWLIAEQPDNPASCPAPLALYCFESP